MSLACDNCTNFCCARKGFMIACSSQQDRLVLPIDAFDTATIIEVSTEEHCVQLFGELMQLKRK